jgi:hypothetical protein
MTQSEWSLTCEYSDPLSADVGEKRTPLAPRLAPKLASFDLFITLNPEPNSVDHGSES